jgi:hypothetical protein
MMGIMASERDGRVFATDERYVYEPYVDGDVTCADSQLLYRQWDYDSPSWVTIFQNGSDNAFGKDRSYATISYRCCPRVLASLAVIDLDYALCIVCLDERFMNDNSVDIFLFPVGSTPQTSSAWDNTNPGEP